MRRETVIDGPLSCTRGALLTSLAVAGAVALGGCKKGDDDKSPESEPTAVEPEAPEPKPDPGPVDQSQITWINDDYDKALARAKEVGKPLVIDMWAPWCHTCLSMKHYVLIDKALAKYADRFVWLALDTDKDKNAEAVSRFPPAAWPTFFVVDTDEKVASRFVGAATVDQFRDFLESGERAVREGADLAPGSAEWHLREGERKASAREHAAAAKAYAAALDAAPDDWPRRPDVLVSRIGSLFKAGDKEACAALGDRIGETTASKSASTSDFAYYAGRCSESLEDEAARALRKKLLATLVAVLEDPGANLSVDDRSDGWRIARNLHLKNGEDAAVAKAAETQRKILAQAVAEAHSPRARMTYNGPRLELYVFLERGAQLVADLEQSATDLPEEYDPPYRLAQLQLSLGRFEEAEKNAERAVELAYGPRKARALSLLADIHRASGETGEARKLREQVLAHVKSLPEGQRSESLIAWAKKELASEKESP